MNKINENFAESRQKVRLYIHAVVLQRRLQSLIEKNELLVGKTGSYRPRIASHPPPRTPYFVTSSSASSARAAFMTS